MAGLCERLGSSQYLLTPWCRVLLEKLTDSQLVKKFPAFYGTQRFITAFTSARHLSLSWARSIQSLAIEATQTQHPKAVRSFFNYFSICFGRSFDRHQVEGTSTEREIVL